MNPSRSDLLLASTSGCQKPCTHTDYGIYTLPDFLYEPLSNASDFLVYWNTMDVIHSSEDLLYDTSSIVAAVGGSLGLFLGFSCYDLAKRGISMALGQ